MSLFIIMLVMCLVNKKGTPSPTIKGTYLFIYIYIYRILYTQIDRKSARYSIWLTCMLTYSTGMNLYWSQEPKI